MTRVSARWKFPLSFPLASAGTPVKPDVEASRQQQQARPRIDVVFVLDMTGSMSGLLEGAKQKIFSIASRISQGRPTPQLRVGLVAYRDVGDEYVTKRFELTEELAAERDSWRAKNVSEKEDAFDANVMRGVKKQAAKHHLAY